MVAGTVAIPCYPTWASDIQSKYARHYRSRNPSLNN
jgi:hypothetical protein